MSRFKLSIVITLIIILVLAMLTFTLLYYYRGTPLPILDKIVRVPFFEQTPETVVSSMIKKMASVQTLHLEVESDTIVQTDSSPFSINSQIIYDGGLKDGLIGHLKFNNEIKLQSLSFLTDFEIRSTSDKSYYRITGIPIVPFVDLNEVTNKWYEYVPDSEITNKSVFSVNDILLNSNIFTVTNRLSDEIIDGHRTYHYLARVNNDAISELLVNMPSYSTKDNNNWEKDIFDLYIGKDDMLLYAFDGTITSEKYQISFKSNVTKINEAVSVDVPAESKSTVTFYKDLFGNTNFLDIPLFGYLAGLDLNDRVTDVDGDGLYLLWEDLFGTESDNPDSDGDGFTDGEEVRNGYNPKGKGRLFDSSDKIVE